MVRLVVTDFSTKEENEKFYINDEFDVVQNMFTYENFKKHSVYLSKYDTSDEVYSLNLLSKKYLDNNELLIYVADEEYYILFNHKTVYMAKINPNFITDDMMKSILITRHIALLSTGGHLENIHYIVNSKYNNAIENILKQNIKSEKSEVIVKPLGTIDNLVKSLNELDTINSYTIKSSIIVGTIVSIAWVMIFGLNMLSDKLLYKQSLDNAKNQLKIEKRLAKRQTIILRNTNRKYRQLTDCITKDEVRK